MATTTIRVDQHAPRQPYNSYFVGLNDLKYVPPYVKDVPDTPTEVACTTKGDWPKWLEGSFMR